MTSTSDHLRRALATDPAAPRLTFYDDASGERVELSTTTLANWVAKTTNLLVLECGVGPGARVSLHLPRHWTTAVWVLAADAVGAEVALGPGRRRGQAASDVAVVGPDGVDDPPDADEVFAVSLAPLGAPFRTTLPTLVRDYAVDVRLMPDQVAVAGAARAARRPGRAAGCGGGAAAALTAWPGSAPSTAWTRWSTGGSPPCPSGPAWCGCGTQTRPRASHDGRPSG